MSNVIEMSIKALKEKLKSCLYLLAYMTVLCVRSLIPPYISISYLYNICYDININYWLNSFDQN